jgi:hypothetical protein
LIAAVAVGFSKCRGTIGNGGQSANRIISPRLRV